MNLRARWALMPVLFGLSLAGCVKPVDCDTLKPFKVGVATLGDAEKVLGKPTQKVPAKDGTTLVRWESSTHSYVGGGTVTGIQLTFGADGRLLKKDCSTSVQAPLVQEPGGY